LAVYLRTKLLLPLDDLLAVVHEFIEPAMSRSTMDRLLRLRGHSRLLVPQMAAETNRRCVFVAIDRATRWVFIAIKSHKTAVAAGSFLSAVAKAAPMRLRTLITDNGREFTDSAFGQWAKDASDKHGFDALCRALGIEHRFTNSKHPQTNDMVERFNGRIAQPLNTHYFHSAKDLAQTHHRFVWLYNHRIPEKALHHEAPIQALKRWQQSQPDLFSKQVWDRPGPDTDRGSAASPPPGTASVPSSLAGSAARRSAPAQPTAPHAPSRQGTWSCESSSSRGSGPGQVASWWCCGWRAWPHCMQVVRLLCRLSRAVTP